MSYVFWNKILYLWSPIYNSFGSTFNSFVNVGIQGLKISEAITSFSKLKKNRSLLEGIAN